MDKDVKYYNHGKAVGLPYMLSFPAGESWVYFKGLRILAVNYNLSYRDSGFNFFKIIDGQDIRDKRVWINITSNPSSLYLDAATEVLGKTMSMKDFKGKIVIDAGCGASPFISDVSHHAAKAIGIDIFSIDGLIDAASYLEKTFPGHPLSADISHYGNSRAAYLYTELSTTNTESATALKGTADYVFDIFGPGRYSKNLHETNGLLEKMLKPGGMIIQKT